MDNDTLRKVQNTMLSMAKDVVRVCEANGIRYFLDGGTMLGAIRHKGFIPWDDDFDMGMLREDYEKFLVVAKEQLAGKYFIQTMHSDEKYGFWFAKVRLLDTVYESAGEMNTSEYNGFYLDVFPYDNYPDGEKERKKTVRKIEFFKRALLAKTDYPIWNLKDGFSLSRFLSYKALKFALFPIGKDKIANAYDKTAKAFNGRKTRDVFPQGNSRSGKFHMEARYFADYVSKPFEDTSFSVLDSYDIFLSTLYGDYMTLPPEGERENRHNIKKISFREEA